MPGKLMALAALGTLRHDWLPVALSVFESGAFLNEWSAVDPGMDPFRAHF